MSAEQLLKSASALSPVERLDLAEAILDGLDQPDQGIDQSWAAEAKDRLAAFRRGEVSAVALGDVLAKYHAR
jgi:putative addiction module component (TIGR02574 family)